MVSSSLLQLEQNEQETLEKYLQLSNNYEKLYNTLEKSIYTYESEKEWLSLEVHDRITPNMTAVFHYAQTMEQDSFPISELKSMARKCATLCKETIQEARNLMRELCPPILNGLSFLEAIEEDAQRLNDESGCRVSLNFPNTLRLNKTTEIVLYRIIHEALSNAARHSNARTLSITLVSGNDDKTLTALVEDNGRGFNLKEVLARKPLGGIISMQRRAQSIGGVCQICSHPTTGTTVVISIPKDMDASFRNLCGRDNYERNDRCEKGNSQNNNS
jgi:two-component system, NarL family, sensor kinase